jgi:membrane protease YdiL (CAAX protease family)
MKLNSPSTTFFAKFRTIILGYIVLAVWMVANSHFMTWLYPPPPPDPNMIGIPPDYVPPFRYDFFFAVLWAPFWEEFTFRHAAGLIVKKIGNGFLMPIMIISSVIFASGHSDSLQLNVMRQGVMGMIFFYVYVKNGYSVWSSMLLHAAWNATVMFAPDAIW